MEAKVKSETTNCRMEPNVNENGAKRQPKDAKWNQKGSQKYKHGTKSEPKGSQMLPTVSFFISVASALGDQLCLRL
jgi:hypothetical protein